MTQPHFSRTQLRRAVLSSYLGSVIEYYDFLLYATASAIVFNKVFFSNLDPLVGTVASFGTLATGYLARPLGGIVFGHFGDRIGRKKMLVLSMTLMGVAARSSACCPPTPRSACGPRSCWCSCASCRASRSAASGAARC